MNIEKHKLNLKDKILIIGHKNPDTDSICSAIAYAYLKNKLTKSNDFIPCRIGHLNAQTEYILAKAKVDPPLFISDIYIKVKDVMTSDVLCINNESPLVDAIKIMQDKRVRIVPVKNNADKLVGVVSLFSLNEHLLSVTSPMEDLNVKISLQNLIKVLNAKILSGNIKEKIFDAEFVVTVMGTYSFINEIKNKDTNKIILFTSDRNDIIMMGIEYGIKIIVITGGIEPNPDAIKKAQENGVLLIITDFNITRTLNLAKLSIPAGFAVEQGNFTINQNSLLSDAKSKLLSSKLRGLVVTDDKGDIQGILTRSNLLQNIKHKIILVDHNEKSQSVAGLSEAEILEVIDHHRIGNFNTNKPITFFSRPIGSTCSIIASLFKEYKIQPPKKIALLLLAGILSDTVIFKSPTCTQEDIELAKWLSEICSVNPEKFGYEIYQKSSKLHIMSSTDIITSDMKTYHEGKIAFSISQIEVFEFSEIDERINELIEELNKLRNSNNYLFSALMVTNITEGDSLIIYSGDSYLINLMGFKKYYNNNVYFANGIISRKKQLVPTILSLLKERINE